MYQTKHFTNSNEEDTKFELVIIKMENSDSPPVCSPHLSNAICNDTYAAENKDIGVLRETIIKVEITRQDNDIQETKIKVERIPDEGNDDLVRNDESFDTGTEEDSSTINTNNRDVKFDNIFKTDENPSHWGYGYKTDDQEMLSHVKIQCDKTDLCTDELQYTGKEDGVKNLLHPRTSHVASNVERNYACRYCDYKSSHKSSVVYHERIHTGEKPYACKHCNYRSTTNANLIKHSKQHTGEKQYACTFCDYRSNYKVDLIRHSRLHTGEKPYKCNYCDYRSNDKGHLTKHSRRHTGEKPYECKHCDYRSASKTSLIVHNRQHTGEKPYACEYCDYRGINKSHLDRHSRCHTGEKPYACNDCDYRSSDRANLMRHMRRQGHFSAQEVK